MATVYRPPVFWSGWVRRGKGRWRLFCRAATAEACWAELLSKSPAGRDKLVRQGDADPNTDTSKRGIKE
jgi:hypothetical protein